MFEERLTLSVLSEEGLRAIEATAYRLLDQVGISLQHTAATEMLHGRGCRIEQGRVYIPEHVVQWALKNVTAHRSVYRVDGSPAHTYGDGRVRFHNGGGPPFVYDLESGARRPATLQDVADVTRLLDALPNVDVVIPLLTPQDVPAELMVVASTETMLRHTLKPVAAAAVEKPAQVPYLVEMAAACCGGMEAFRRSPTMSIYVSPVSPLTFTHDVTACILAVAQSGAPFHSLPAPSLGATGPITMAGALAQQHAEVLASLVLAACAQAGAPVLYCSRINPIDLRTATSSWGGPEVGMSGACAAQLAHRLGLACDSFGFCCSTGRLDPQLGYQRLSNALIPALAGVDLLSGVATLDSGLCGGFEAAVIDDEMIGVIKQIAGGCPVNDDTLAFDVMSAVIPRDGIFLSERHTVRHMRRKALWVPAVSDAGATGEESIGVVARARERAQHILQTHQVEPLPEDVQRTLADIMARARHELPGA